MSRPIVDDVPGATGRWRPFAVLAVAVLLLHAWLLDGAWADRAPPPPSAGPVRVRALEESAPVPVPVPAPGAEPATLPAAVDAATRLAQTPVDGRAVRREVHPAVAAPPAPLDLAPPDAKQVLTSEPVQPGSGTSVSPVDVDQGPAPAPDPADPPPTYATRLPPPLTLRYAMRRGFLSATGELRWQPDGDRYRLLLEARAGDALLLTQASSGAIGPAGLEPERFVDQRLRRAPQAANFDRSAGTIGYSSTDRTHALVPGTQDRLSLYLQLAGIAAADPARLQPGAMLVIAVAGARGDAAIWQLRVVGPERLRSADGGLDTVRLARDRRGPADTVVDLWLAPGRHWLPVRASWRTAQGASEYDLMLDGVSAGP